MWRNMMRPYMILTFSFCVFLSVGAFRNSSTANVQGQTSTSISGTITDKGVVISGVTVRAKSLQTGAERPATTDENGHYTLKDLPIGEYEIIIETGGFYPYKTKVSLGLNDSKSLDIDLESGPEPVGDSNLSVIRGTVKDSNNIAIEGARVFIIEANTDDEVKVLTNKEGKYQKTGLTPGRYKVKAEADGFQVSEKHIPVFERGPKVLDFMLRRK
jgi:uncharacterized surface anchored protein